MDTDKSIEELSEDDLSEDSLENVAQNVADIFLWRRPSHFAEFAQKFGNRLPGAEVTLRFFRRSAEWKRARRTQAISADVLSKFSTCRAQSPGRALH